MHLQFVDSYVGLIPRLCRPAASTGFFERIHEDQLPVLVEGFHGRAIDQNLQVENQRPWILQGNLNPVELMSIHVDVIVSPVVYRYPTPVQRLQPDCQMPGDHA